MTQDDPLSTLLPKPPLPRPDRREAAIEEAMRRFDGTPPATGRSARAGRNWLGTPWGRPQIGAVLATALVGLVALPLWVSRDRHPELTNSGAKTFSAAPAAPATTRTTEKAASSPSTVAARPTADIDIAVAPDTQVEQRAPAGQSEKAEAVPGAAGAIATSAAKPEEAVVSVSRRTENLAPPAIVLAEPVIAPAPPPPPPAAPVMRRAAAANMRDRDEGSNDVIVTARRVESAKAAPAPRPPQARRTSRAGDWNACTVNDPTRSLESCTERASGHIADGLTRAWKGDLDGAIAAFNQAIATSQQPGLAYLNRGLAYERKGDRDRALTDLDHAIRQTPNSARAYYNRSLALQRKGEKDGAGADADRAIELDPRYRVVIH